MKAIAAVLYREGKIRFTNSVWIFWDMLYPLGYLLVFGVGINYTMGSPVAGTDYNAFFLASVLAMACFGIASNSAWGFFTDRDNGIFYEMLTYPLSRAEFLIGKVTFNLLLGIIQAVVTVAASWLILDVPVRFDLSPLLILGIVGGTAGWFFFYAIFALRIRRNDLFNTLNSIFYFVFLFISSMFYPLEPLPSWFRALALANPVTWHVDLLRYSTIGIGDPFLVAVETAGFGLFSAAALAYAVRALRQQ
jgi:ABC-2 type transport system permease protein